MRSLIYNLEQSQVPWYCWNCGLPNFSSEIFSSVPAESIHPSLLDISRASSLSSKHSSQHQDLSDSQLNAHLTFDSPHTPPLFSTPAHSLSPPSFSSSPKSTGSSPKSDFASGATPVKLDKSLRSLTVNFQSIRNKKAELLNLIQSSNPDIIFGTETWLKPSEFSSEFFPQNYVVYRKDRPDGYGGCLLAIKSDYISHEIPHSTNAEAVYVRVQTDGRERPLTLGVIYRTPSIKNKQQAQEQIGEITRSMEVIDRNDTIWIAGDMNLPDIDWTTNQIVSNQYHKDTNLEILNKLDELNLHQMAKEPTRGKHILDIFCTNKPNLVSRSNLIPGLSDHDIILVDSRIKAKKNKPIAHEVSVWKKADFDAIKKETTEFVANFNKNPPNTSEELWEVIKTHLKEMMRKHVPTKKKSTKHHQPWINGTIKRLSRRKQRAWRKAKRWDKQPDWDRYKNLQKETRRESRRAYQGYIRSLIEEESGKHLFKFIKSRKNGHSWRSAS